MKHFLRTSNASSNCTSRAAAKPGLRARLRFAAARFRAETAGTLSVETVMVFPLLLWAYGATFLFWDAFRAQNINLKAAFTVADALSRETSAIDATYLNGLNGIYDFLTYSNHPVRMRVSTIRWDEADNRYEFFWSETTSTAWPKHTVNTLNANAFQIPKMASGDLAILVETQMAYEPFIKAGIPAMIMENFVVTRPRFGPQLVWKSADGTLYGNNLDVQDDGTSDSAEDTSPDT